MREIDWEDRFWSKVDRMSGLGPEGTCWEWTAYRNKAGYGKFRIGGRRGKSFFAHRLSYELYAGSIPIDKGCICHTCDNTSCVNPTHLYPGTHKDNSDQMISRKRAGWITKPQNWARGDRSGARLHPERILRGDAHPSTKIPDARIPEIFAMRADGMLLREIALQFDVTDVLISSILKGKHRKPWTNVSMLQKPNQ